MRFSAKLAQRVNFWLTLLWIALVAPTVTIWHNSILWVGFISIWANVISHYTAYEAARVEVREEQLESRVDGRA